MVKAGSPMRDAIRTMSERRLGMTCVVREDGTLAGVITDGDLRRHLGQGDDLLAMKVDRVMTGDPATIGAQELAAAALRAMETRKITSLVVVDDASRVQGVLHIHDLWRTQLF
jgi:arabinose-5-phosphate isomerase